MIIHTVPAFDSILHIESVNCPCHPRVRFMVGNLWGHVIHNTVDEDRITVKKLFDICSFYDNDCHSMDNKEATACFLGPCGQRLTKSGATETIQLGVADGYCPIIHDTDKQK